jgi:hypothetical protein
MKSVTDARQKSFLYYNQDCGSGLDPDSMILRIRIRNPDPGSGSSGMQMKKKILLKFFLAIFITLRHKIVQISSTGYFLFKILILNTLKIRLWIRIQ